MENNIQQKEIKKNARQIINENFFGLLKERKISLKEYAKENGLDPSTISKWKSGNSSMNTEELRRAADFLNVTVNDLTYSNEEKKKIDVLSQRDYKPIFAQQSKTIHYLSDLFNKPMQAIIKQLFLFFAFGILCSSIIRFSSYWALLMIAPCLLLYPCFYQQGIGTKKIYIINYLDDIYYQIEKENNQFFLFVLIIRVLIILFGGIFIAFISFYYPDSWQNWQDLTFLSSLSGIFTLIQLIISFYSLLSLEKKLKEKIYETELNGYNASVALFLCSTNHFFFGIMMFSVNITRNWIFLLLVIAEFICAFLSYYFTAKKYAEYVLVYQEDVSAPRVLFPKNKEK